VMLVMLVWVFDFVAIVASGGYYARRGSPPQKSGGNPPGGRLPAAVAEHVQHRRRYGLALHRREGEQFLHSPLRVLRSHGP